jgi:hypothetical protein
LPRIAFKALRLTIAFKALRLTIAFEDCVRREQREEQDSVAL